MNDNVTKTEFGYEVLWANTEHYCSKILVFEHIGSKTNMSFTKDTTKSWFVNSGLECLYAGSAIAETATKYNPQDVYHVIPAGNIESEDE
jgi:hypothetical protein